MSTQLPLETLPCEWEKFADEQTGANVIRLTSAQCVNHPLYYLTNTFTVDGRWLIFASDRAGKPDLYRASLEDGRIQRLTDLDGLQPFSGNVVDDRVYFTTDAQLHCLSLAEGVDRVIAERPGCGLGEVTLSCDQRWAAALVTRGDVAGLLIAATDGSSSNVILEGRRALYHPQFHPTKPDRLIYSADPPDPRMWTVRIDGSDDRCIYANQPNEWFVHETFLGQSERIIVVHWHHGLYLVGLEDGQLSPITDLNAWHIASNSLGSLIACDTHLPDIGLCLINPDNGEHRCLCHPRATSKGWQWRQELPLQADGEAPGWATMVEDEASETAYGPQWTHPHPSFSPDGRLIAFTSDATGYAQAYVVEVPS